MNLRARLWLCLSALVPWGADVVLTLLGQPSAYWAGDFSKVREDNPLGDWLLQLHPGWFIAGAVLWAGIFSGILLWGPVRLALYLGFVVAVGHALGASSWLVAHGWAGMGSAVGLLVVVERMLSRSLATLGSKARS